MISHYLSLGQVVVLRYASLRMQAYHLSESEVERRVSHPLAGVPRECPDMQIQHRLRLCRFDEIMERTTRRERRAKLRRAPPSETSSQGSELAPPTFTIVA